MQIEQRLFDPARGWTRCGGDLGSRAPQLVLLFGGRALLSDPGHFHAVRALFPGAHIVSASTSGEITGTDVTEDHLALTAIAFDHTRVAAAATTVDQAGASYEAGRQLAGALAGDELVHVLAISDGALVNGTELSRGFNETLPPGVILTGGLAGDGTRFQQTLVGLDEPPVSGRIAAIGLYGRRLRVAFGSSGGWAPFGPGRLVTAATGNVLQSLDGQSALQLYKKYLGDHAAQLPASALRFPLAISPAGGGPPLVRTILSIDEQAETMTFAGDIPVGSHVRFMRASYEDLIDGAARAAAQTHRVAGPELAICVSCVGRRIVLGQRTEEETETVRDSLGPGVVLTGFYSYGELAPADAATACQLHNQTMTITTLQEV